MNDRPIVIFDLDNCLADDSARIQLIDWTQSDPDKRYNAYHKNCQGDSIGNKMVLDAHVQHGCEIVVFTARPESVRMLTMHWLQAVGVPTKRVYMRPEGVHTSSVALKRQMLEDLSLNFEGLSKNTVAYDDRDDVVEMYRSFGIEGRKLKIHDLCAYTRPGHKIDDRFAKLASEPTSAADILQEMSDTFRERNAVYGDNYKMVGKLMAVLFPNGVSKEILHSDQFHLFELKLVKLSRFAISGLQHQDSIHDDGVYSAMIESIVIQQQGEKS